MFGPLGYLGFPSPLDGGGVGVGLGPKKVHAKGRPHLDIATLSGTD